MSPSEWLSAPGVLVALGVGINLGYGLDSIYEGKPQWAPLAFLIAVSVAFFGGIHA